MQETEFSGDYPGDVTIKVHISKGHCEYGSTADATVVEINDLGDLPPVWMDFVDVDGAYRVPFLADGAKLRRVLIAPVDDESYPYEWGTDYSASVDHATGDVNVLLNRPGPYTVKIVRRTESGEFTESHLKLLHQCGAGLYTGMGGKGSTTTTDKRRRPKPDAVLVVISSVENDAYLAGARVLFPDHVPIASCNGVNNAIMQKYAEINRDRPTPIKITVLVIDHGNAGMQGMGIQLKKELRDQPGHYLHATPGMTPNEEAAFIQACKGRVSSVTFLGCKVAQGAEAERWFQDMADQGGMTVSGYSGETFFTQEIHNPGVQFETAKDARFVSKSPQ